MAHSINCLSDVSLVPHLVRQMTHSHLINQDHDSIARALEQNECGGSVGGREAEIQLQHHDMLSDSVCCSAAFSWIITLEDGETGRRVCC